MAAVVFLRGGSTEERRNWAEVWLSGGVRRMRVDIDAIGATLRPGQRRGMDEAVMACAASAMLTAVGMGVDVGVVSDVPYKNRDVYLEYTARKKGAETLVKDFDKA